MRYVALAIKIRSSRYETTTTVISLYFAHNLKDHAIHLQESKVKYKFKFKQINPTKSKNINNWEKKNNKNKNKNNNKNNKNKKNNTLCKLYIEGSFVKETLHMKE